MRTRERHSKGRMERSPGLAARGSRRALSRPAAEELVDIGNSKLRVRTRRGAFEMDRGKQQLINEGCHRNRSRCRTEKVDASSPLKPEVGSGGLLAQFLTANH